jgi:hypothetical protein
MSSGTGEEKIMNGAAQVGAIGIFMKGIRKIEFCFSMRR